MNGRTGRHVGFWFRQDDVHILYTRHTIRRLRAVNRISSAYKRCASYDFDSVFDRFDRCLIRYDSPLRTCDGGIVCAPRNAAHTRIWTAFYPPRLVQVPARNRPDSCLRSLLYHCLHIRSSPNRSHSIRLLPSIFVFVSHALLPASQDLHEIWRFQKTHVILSWLFCHLASVLHDCIEYVVVLFVHCCQLSLLVLSRKI